MKNTKSFTLVELMMAVAIVMILAAIAIPYAYQMQLRARKSELDTNIDGMRTSEIGYNVAEDVWYISSPFVPDANPGKTPRAWGGYPIIGFEPDGDVRGSYRLGAPGLLCTPTGMWAGSCTDEVCIVGMTNVDADAYRSCGYQTTADHKTVWYTNSTIY